MILTHSDADAVLHQQGVAIIWGHAVYSDIFDRDSIKTIDFCYTLAPSIDSIQSPDKPIIFNKVPFRTDCNHNSDDQ